MVNIDGFTKQTGMFLKAEDVIESPEKTFIIAEESQLVEDAMYGGQRLHIVGTFNGETKTFNCSKTNARTIAEKTGKTETVQWIGTVLVLETYRTKISDGRMVDAINVKEVRTAPAPAATA